MATRIVFLSLKFDVTNSIDLELGFSNGLPGGSQVLDLYPGLDGSSHFNPSWPHFFTPLGDKIIFQATDGTSGRELWITDGTPGGTQLLKDINAVAPTATHDGFINNQNFNAFSQIDFAKPVVIGNTAYFGSNDGVHGFELWKTNGTTAGTTLVADINTTGAGGINPSNPFYLVNLNGTLYFTADDGTHYRQIWKSDGTPGNTTQVTNLVEGAGGDPNNINPFSLTVSGNNLYFIYNDGTANPLNAQQLYVLDNSDPAGARPVSPSHPALLDVRELTDINGTLYFGMNDGTNGLEVWKTDGSDGGTAMVADINPGGPLGPGAQGSAPFGFHEFNGKTYFGADDGTHGFELWVTDGTPGGTHMVKDINQTPNGVGFTEGSVFSGFVLVEFQNKLYFTATDGNSNSGQELWRTDGTQAGTELVADLNPGNGGSTPSVLQVIDGVLYFGSNLSVNNQNELYAYDGVNPPQLISTDYHYGAGFEVFSAIAATSPNQAPVNTVPGTQNVEANTATEIAGLSIADPDAASGTVTTTLSVAHGTLTVASAGGAGVSGSGTASVTLTGTVAAINTTLSAANNIVYKGGHDFFGADTLTVLTNDGGNTGSGGALTDTDNVTINLNTLINGTPNNDSYNALPGQEMINGLGGIDTITFNFKLVDAAVTYEGNRVIIDGPTGSHTVLTGFEVFNFTDGTVHNDDGSPLIDDLFYYSRYHDVWNAHLDADADYNATGWHSNRDPSAFFSTSVYLSANPDVKAGGGNPLDHFDQNGWKEGRVPSINFDPAQYLAANPDVAAAHVDPLRHYLAFGYQEGRQPFAPSELIAANGFDYVYYLNHNPDVAASGVDPFWHFETVGWKEGRNPNALFDVNGYLANYADVAAAHINPLDHYNQFGWKEGRDPSPGFDTTDYLAAYADVNAAHVNPLTHFLHYGIHEGRSPFADGVWG